LNQRVRKSYSLSYRNLQTLHRILLSFLYLSTTQQQTQPPHRFREKCFSNCSWCVLSSVPSLPLSPHVRNNSLKTFRTSFSHLLASVFPVNKQPLTQINSGQVSSNCAGVSNCFTNLTGAIFHAAPNDYISIAAGEWPIYQDVNLYGKPLSIVGAGSGSTMINCTSSNYYWEFYYSPYYIQGVTFFSCEGKPSRLIIFPPLLSSLKILAHLCYDFRIVCATSKSFSSRCGS